MDSGLQDKAAPQGGGVEESIRHLTNADLEGYLQGRLSPAPLKHCRTHLDSCEACRAELEDLRTFQSNSASFARSEPQRRELGRGRRRRGLALPAAAAIATVVVAGISAYLWWGRERPRVNKTSVAVAVTHPVTHPVAPVPTAVTQTRDTRIADAVAALPVDVRPAVSDVIQHGKLQLPPDVNQLRGHAHTLLGAPEANAGFALLSPFGDAITETRPEFRWQPLPGAIRYSVAIVDAGLHPVQRSPALRTTSWRPRRPLRRGQTYLWQVTATLHGRSKVVASTSEALLRIIPNKLADELARFRKGHEDAHLVLGALYAQAGLLTESAEELKKVAPGDSSYSTARTLLESLPSTGPDDTSRMVLQTRVRQ
jgi:hypothetical protein